MQKIKKGLQEKLHLISKIKNNLKIKKYDLNTSSPKTKVDLPIIQKHPDSQFNESLQFQSSVTKNPENQTYTWINIKRLANHQRQLQGTYSGRQSYKSFDDKILISTFTNRFSAKNNLMKVIQLKTLAKDKSSKNISSQFLRRTFLQKNSRTFSPDKLEKNKFKLNLPQKDMTFYGKMNSTNHVSGIRFKTLDPRYGGLSRQELKEKIRKRELLEGDFTSFQSQNMRIPEPRNIYELNLSYNPMNSSTNRQRRSQFSRYSSISYDITPNQEKRSRRRNKSRSKDRYSPWNQNSQQVIWDQLPKIK